MPAAFKASLITPEAIMLEANVTFAQVPAVDGLVGILNQRAPLLAKLGTGIIRLDTVAGAGAAGGQQKFFVSGGYAQMKGQELTILTAEAIPVAQVTDDMLKADQAKLATIKGGDLKSMEDRQALQNRIMAIRQARRG